MALSRSAKLSLALAIFVLAASALYFAGSAALEWRHEQKMDDRIDEMLALMKIPPQSDFHQTVDAVRIFINDHSEDNVDAIFRIMNGDAASFADGLIAHARDPSAERVHMECSTRANLMGRVLRRMGYKTRTIAIFKTKGQYSSHTFLDVLNPETKKWETQDPDYDIYWTSLPSKTRVSLAEEAENLDAIEPCGRSACSWGHVSRDGNTPKSLIDKLDILSVTSKERDVRYSVYTTRAKLKHRFAIGGETGTYCEVMAKRCRDGFQPIGIPRGDLVSE
jgi:hypothetical protein